MEKKVEVRKIIRSPREEKSISWKNVPSPKRDKKIKFESSSLSKLENDLEYRFEHCDS